MKIYLKNSIATSVLLLLAGCEGTKTLQPPVLTNLPDWVTVCVVASSDLSIDRQQALSNAQVSLAQQIKATITEMDNKLQAEKQGDQIKSNIFSENSNVALQSAVLHGTRILHQDYVNIRGVDQFCIQTSFPESEQTSLFNNLLQTSKTPITEQEKQNLYNFYIQNLIVQGKVTNNTYQHINENSNQSNQIKKDNSNNNYNVGSGYRQNICDHQPGLSWCKTP